MIEKLGELDLKPRQDMKNLKVYVWDLPSDQQNTQSQYYLFNQTRKKKTLEMISKLGGKNSMRLEGQIDFDKIDLKKMNSNSNDIVTIAKDDYQEAIKIFIQWRDRVIKEHRAGGKPKSNALSEVSAT